MCYGKLSMIRKGSKTVFRCCTCYHPPLLSSIDHPPGDVVNPMLSDSSLFLYNLYNWYQVDTHDNQIESDNITLKTSSIIPSNFVRCNHFVVRKIVMPTNHEHAYCAPLNDCKVLHKAFGLLMVVLWYSIQSFISRLAMYTYFPNIVQYIILITMREKSW